MPTKNCWERFKKALALHAELMKRAKVKYDGEVSPPKEILDAIKEMQDETAVSLEKIYSDLGLKGKGKPPVPPKEPAKTKGGGDLSDKALATRLVGSENIPEAAKKKIEENGLKYEPASQDEARSVAKGIVDELGMDEAIKAAEGRRFFRGVNSAIFAESLDKTFTDELKSATKEEKAANAMKWADYAIRYDEWLRGLGTEIAYVNHFYKKSPLGVRMAEKMKRDKSFRGWYAKREKPFKEVFDELTKEPEFETLLNEKVQEELKKERVEHRKARIKKVEDTIDGWIRDIENGKVTYSVIVPPKLLVTTLQGVKKAYRAGEATAKVIQEAIEDISKALGVNTWDSEKFRAKAEEILKEKQTAEQLYQTRLRNEIKELGEQVDARKRKEPTPKEKKEYGEETQKLIEERDAKKKELDELVPKKKPATVEELQKKILDKFWNKLKGLDAEQKAKVIRASFKEIVENGALKYDKFKQIVADVLGLGELTEAEAAKMEGYIADMNALDTKENDVFSATTPESKKAAIKEYEKAHQRAEKSATDLAGVLYNKPDIINRLGSIMQLSALTATSLIKNPVYNTMFQATQRFWVSGILSVLDQAIYQGSKVMNKTFGTGVVPPDFNNITNQKYYWGKFKYGWELSLKQLATGSTNKDYFQKEIYSARIRPLQSWRQLLSQTEAGRNLLKNLTGKDYQKQYLSGTQIADKLIQGTIGVHAEVVARLLNPGDKPYRFASEAVSAATEADRLGFKGIDKEVFMAFPKRMALEYYRNKGLSEEKAQEKAEVIEKRIVREGEEAAFQQENWLNMLMTVMGQGYNNVFGGDDPGSKFLKGAGHIVGKAAVLFRRVPLNAAWQAVNIVVPEIALVQGVLFSGKAVIGRAQGKESARLDYISAKKWFATAVMGMGIQAATQWLASIGALSGGDDERKGEDVKEREAKKQYTRPRSINVTKVARALSGGSLDTEGGDLLVDYTWFGNPGVAANITQNIREEMTTEEREKQFHLFDEFMGERLSRASHEAIENGVFSTATSLLMAYANRNAGFGNNLFVNMFNTVANIAQPGTFAQWSRAQIPYEYRIKADGFWQQLGNNMAARSGLYRTFTGHYPPARVSIWGEKIDKDSPVFMQMLGMRRADKDNFAQPLWDEYEKTGNIEVFPSLPKGNFTMDGETIKLNMEQLDKFQELVGRERASMIKPFVNGMASVMVWNKENKKMEEKKFSELSPAKKAELLKQYYEDGYEIGKEKLLEFYPQLKPKETTRDEVLEGLVIPKPVKQ